jgi:hypothetical protein
MPSRQERRKHARSEQRLGTVSRHAQRRVNRRVLEIMARRDAAQHPDSRSDQAASARRLTRRAVARPG